MSVLDSIIAGVRADMDERRSRVPLTTLEQQLEACPPTRNPMSVFRDDGLSVIAEVKRKSPSKGALAAIDDPAALAHEYEAGGASAISVLTEQRRFGGSLDDLDAVRARVEIPVLRKDFMVDEYQFLEARVHGADLVLLIVAALTDAELARFLQLARDLQLTPLVEVHTAKEADRALTAGAELIGVNNRNLKTLDVDLANFGRLASHIGDDVVRVAESGIFTPDDARRVRDEGADVILVGEALVRHGQPRQAVSALRAS
uniref:indole-3-glycerol phosphate synthase TrpC n=1 Tax=Tessaracoccus timonensis TaxID=2161816 RepID=UPI000D54D1AC|nr:indole-3-glycerol phosphate synthase TrpC [Tessaracoccus timonensis]